MNPYVNRSNMKPPPMVVITLLHLVSDTINKALLSNHWLCLKLLFHMGIYLPFVCSFQDILLNILLEEACILDVGIKLMCYDQRSG